MSSNADGGNEGQFVRIVGKQNGCRLVRSNGHFVVINPRLNAVGGDREGRIVELFTRMGEDSIKIVRVTRLEGGGIGDIGEVEV